jgi:transcriptional regulator with XRE-family HTH domain
MGMTPIQAKQLGRLIAKARARKGQSLRDLASELGVHASWLGFLEQGRYVEPAPDRLARIAEALDIEPSRIDRITRGSVAESLPEIHTYFRAKYDLSAEEIAKVERYIRRLGRSA